MVQLISNMCFDIEAMSAHRPYRASLGIGLYDAQAVDARLAPFGEGSSLTTPS